jgi:cytochrome c peroxidase
MKALSRLPALAASATIGAFSALAATSPITSANWTWTLPSTLPPPRVPADNPMSEAKFELGRALFYDKRVSGNGTLACGSCHLQERGFTDGRAVSPGSTGETTPRNAQGLANVAWHATYTWANRALVTLERQMEVPLFGTNPIEMGVTDANKQEILARFAADPFYAKHFKDAFPEASNPVSFDSIIKAIATFERGLVSSKSRYDLYLEGKLKFTEAEQRGHDLFFGEKAECHHCHGSTNFDDQFVHAKSRDVETPFHNTGLYNIDHEGAYPRPNRGLLETSGNPDDMGRFRAPSLRNVAMTAPYMHDGSVATLEDVIEIYSRGGRSIATGPLAGNGRVNPHKSDLIVPIDFTNEEKADLLAFLATLTDETFLHAAKFSNPWTAPNGLAQDHATPAASP